MLHLRQCRLHKGIVIVNKPLQQMIYPSFSSTAKQTKQTPQTQETQQSKQTKQAKQSKKLVLSQEPPTPFPPVNAKLFDYEKQKGPKALRSELQRANTINIGGLFLFGGVLCGAIISIFAPKDFRHDFKFYSCLPDAYFTKYEREEPLNVQETFKIDDAIQFDRVSAATYSIILGLSGGAAGSMWFRSWTHPLRIKQLNIFEIGEELRGLRTNSIRNCVKGTFIGSLGVLGMIFASVFFGYLYIGHFYSNKYADKDFWKYMELTYQKNIDSRRSYEINLELQERWREKKRVLDPPIAPSLNAKEDEKGNIDRSTDENYEEINKRLKEFEDKKEKQREMYKKTIKGMEWDTNLYLNTKDISYFKLTDEAKAVRWNMAREMAMLATSCAFYIVVPVFLGTSVVATRIYSKYWQYISKEMLKTKHVPSRLY